MLSLLHIIILSKESEKKPMKKKIVSILCCAAFISSALVGCSGGQKRETETKTEDAAAGDTTEGGEGEADGIVCYVGHGFWDGPIDPLKGKFSYGWSFINNALLKVQPDSTYAGDLAESWEISEDTLTYTFKLKKGIKFTDGSDFTAEDVVFSYQTVQENQGDNEEVDLSKMVSIEAVDDYSVKIVLSEPYSPFLDETAQLGIVPSDAYDSETFNEMPIGTGAWKVVQYDPQQQLIVEANEDYFDGAPSIKKVTFIDMDNEAAFSNAQSGQLDIVMVQPNYATETIDGMHIEKLETMDVRNISLPCSTEQIMTDSKGEEVEVGNNTTADIAVRKALNIGIHRDQIIQNAFNGVGVPAYGFTKNLEWGNAPDVTDGQVEEAIALLEEAGWVDEDGDGVREKGDDKCAFEIYTPSDEQDRYNLAAALAEDAKQLGIEITIKQTTWDEITAASHKAAVVWGFGQFNPIVIDQLFKSDNFLTVDYANTPGYSNEKVDSLIEEAITGVDHDTIISKWKEAQEIYAEDVPYLYLVNIEHCYFVKDNIDISVETQVPHPHGHGIPIICNMKDWTLK